MPVKLWRQKSGADAWVPNTGGSVVNTKPTATITEAKSVVVGAAVTVTITGADEHDDPLTYTFETLVAGASSGARKPTGSTATLSGTGSSRSLTPDVAGTYVVRGYCTDDGGASRGAPNPQPLNSDAVECVITATTSTVPIAGTQGAQDAFGWWVGSGSDGLSVLAGVEAQVGRKVHAVSGNFGAQSTVALTIAGCTVNADDTITTPTAHNLTVRDTVHMSAPVLTGVGETVGGLPYNASYWAIPIDATHFKISLRKNGTPVNLSGSTTTVTIAVHRPLGTARSTATLVRPTYALRPDVVVAWIFHAWSTMFNTNQTKGGVSVNFRKSRRAEVIADLTAASGTWYDIYTEILNRLHSTVAGIAWDGTWFQKAGHGFKIGEKVRITAKSGADAFNRTATANFGTDTFTTPTAHLLAVGQRVTFAAVPAGTNVVVNRAYYVHTVPSSTTFTISDTRATALKDVTGSTTTGFEVVLDYYVHSLSGTDKFKLTTTAPLGVGGAGAAISGGLTGTATIQWHANLMFRISHEGDIVFPRGYPDGRFWKPNLVQSGVVANFGTDTFTTPTAHNYTANMPIQFTAVPAGTNVVANTTYYVRSAGLTSTAFTISTTSGGGLHPITGSTTTGFISIRADVDDLVAEDETLTRDMWQRIATLVRSHDPYHAGFQIVWAGDGGFFTQIKNLGDMGGFATAWPNDVRYAWEYGLPGSTGTDHSNYNDYCEQFNCDLYGGSPANGTKGKTLGTLPNPASGTHLWCVQQLKAAAQTMGVPWGIDEFGFYCVVQTLKTGVSAEADDNYFTFPSNHGYANADRVAIGSVGTLPGAVDGLANQTFYYVVQSDDARKLKLSRTSGGTEINLTSDGLGLMFAKSSGVSDAAIEQWLRDFHDIIEDGPAYPHPGSCAYFNYFWTGPEEGFDTQDIRKYHPAVWDEIFETAPPIGWGGP